VLFGVHRTAGDALTGNWQESGGRGWHGGVPAWRPRL